MANLLFGSISQTEEMCSIIYANNGESLMLFILLSLSFSRYDLNILIFFLFYRNRGNVHQSETLGDFSRRLYCGLNGKTPSLTHTRLTLSGCVSFNKKENLAQVSKADKRASFVPPGRRRFTASPLSWLFFPSLDPC